ncbi:MAG: hypothetical protein MUO76_14450 [Anaerolineaceae bacterium]|nr:hypothetical protein [Anaerolineaceae bacterium]
MPEERSERLGYMMGQKYWHHALLKLLPSQPDRSAYTRGLAPSGSIRVGKAKNTIQTLG